MSEDIPVMGVEHLNRVDTWGSEPKEDNGWISVDDRLPNDNECVFVYCCEQDRIEFVPYVGAWPILVINWATGEQRSAVSHWMPLPLPPMLKEQAS